MRRSYGTCWNSLRLKSMLKKKVSTLSNGTQRRVAIARTFIGRPKILLID